MPPTVLPRTMILSKPRRVSAAAVADRPVGRETFSGAPVQQFRNIVSLKNVQEAGAKLEAWSRGTNYTMIRVRFATLLKCPSCWKNLLRSKTSPSV